MHAVLYLRYYGDLLFPFIYFSLKENEMSSCYLDNCGYCMD